MSFEQLPQKNEVDEPSHKAHDQEVQPAPSNARPKDTILAKARSIAKASSSHTEMTGNAYADEGLGCDGGKGGGGCFLDAGTRQRVVNLFHGRVNAAHINYMGALTQLGIEELLKKEPKESELIMELLLDVIGALTSNVALKIFKLAAGGGHAIADVAASAADVQHGLSHGGEEFFKEGVGMAVSLGKKDFAESVHHDDPSKPTAGTEKASNVGYIDMLKDQSGSIFENIREGMIAGIDDARLLVLFDSFRAANHTVSAYKSALSQKLQRFKASGLGKMGITNNDKWGRLDSGGIDHSAAQIEKHAYWVNMPGGRRLGLYRRAHVPISDLVREPSGLDRGKTPFEKLAEEMQRATKDDDLFFDGFVANEFVDAAVKMHAAKWGYQPRERAVGPWELAQMGTKDEQR